MTHTIETAMKLGVIVDGHWGFIGELLDDWRAHFQTEVFAFEEVHLPVSQGRVNQWRLNRALRRFIKKQDLVFFEWAGPLAIVATRMFPAKPIVVRLHSWELYQYAPHITWDAVSHVILISNAMQQRFCELFPDQAHKSRVIYCGISLERFSLRPPKFAGNIGMLCDLVPIKRVYDIILTIYELKKRGYHLTLHLGGKPRSGSDNQRYLVSMKRAVDKLGLQDRVIFHGWVENPAHWLKAIDIFISNSYWEGQQNALLEAMASGCYCLSHFWDGAEEILPAGFLYATASELQTKIIEYCEQADSQKWAHQSTLRSIAEEKFSFRQNGEKVREMLQDVAGVSDESRGGRVESGIDRNQQG